MTADIDLRNIPMFGATADQHRQQGTQLQTAADAMAQASPVAAGGITGRTEMANLLNEAHTTAATKMTTVVQGFGAYSGTLTAIGEESRRTSELTTAVLGSIINSYERADQATPAGPR
jgi:hypothetical protein